jgi:hypothetical protein
MKWQITKQNDEYTTEIIIDENTQKLLTHIKTLLPEYDEQEIITNLVYLGVIADKNLSHEQILHYDEEANVTFLEDAETFGRKLAKALNENPNTPIQAIIYKLDGELLL